MRYIFGPVNSRRFGISLGIDLSPERKSCNFDCLYCELSRALPVSRIENEPDPEQILDELKQFLSSNPYPDVITITANGEPTLYSKLDTLIDMLLNIKGNSKLLILSNGSTIFKKDIRKALSKLDIVKLSLDSVNEEAFKKIDRPHKDVNLYHIVDGMKIFRKEFKNELIIEVLIVKGINDNEEEISKLAEVVKEIKPDRVDIGTVDRPPAYRVQPVSYEELYNFSKFFDGLNVLVVGGGDKKKREYKLSEEEILRTLKTRPMSESDIKSLFNKETVEKINTLFKEGILKKQVVGNVTFYLVR